MAARGRSNEMTLLTTAEAAQRLGITPAGVRKLVERGRLPAKRFGRDLQIRAADLALVAGRKRGRPRKGGTQ